MKGVYIHIPFCEHLCIYCDFVKERAKPEKMARYVDALLHEIACQIETRQVIDTVYIGGGTPSYLNLILLEKLLMRLQEAIDLKALKEFTIECNPQDINDDLLKLLKRYYVNRISLGIQTFNDSALKLLNRKHTSDTAKNALAMIEKHNFTRVSVDFIFNLPYQTMHDVMTDLKTVITLNIPHISYYSLIVEENTRLFYQLKQGFITQGDNDTEAEMYAQIIDTLTTNGYEHYEISNFAKPNHRSIHNQIYWKDHDYYGFGAGSHGKLNQQRYYNYQSVKQYIEKTLMHGSGLQTTYPYEPVRDYLLMGLRMLEGIDLSVFKTRFGTDIFTLYPKLHECIVQGLVLVENNHLKFTPKGLFFGNDVFALF